MCVLILNSRDTSLQPKSTEISWESFWKFSQFSTHSTENLGNSEKKIKLRNSQTLGIPTCNDIALFHTNWNFLVEWKAPTLSSLINFVEH